LSEVVLLEQACALHGFGRTLQALWLHCMSWGHHRVWHTFKFSRVHTISGSNLWFIAQSICSDLECMRIEIVWNFLLTGATVVVQTDAFVRPGYTNTQMRVLEVLLL
jgi:hypothetical protein